MKRLSQKDGLFLDNIILSLRSWGQNALVNTLLSS
jgi:hypothetical protein